MKKQYPEIEHQLDVWHLANSVRKKLLDKSKLRPVSVTLMVTNISMCWLSMSSKE
jgi:hypothetical protein